MTAIMTNDRLTGDWVTVLLDRGWNLPPPLYHFIEKNNFSSMIWEYF